MNIKHSRVDCTNDKCAGWRRKMSHFCLHLQPQNCFAFFQTLEASFALLLQLLLSLHLLPCQVWQWHRPHKRQLGQSLSCSELGCTSINVSIRVAMAAQPELWPLPRVVLSFTIFYHHPTIYLSIDSVTTYLTEVTQFRGTVWFEIYFYVQYSTFSNFATR